MSSFLTPTKLTFYPSGDAQTGEALGLLTSLWVIRKLGQCPLVEVVDCAFAHEDFLYRIFIFQTLSSLRLKCLKRDYDGYPLGPGCWEKGNQIPRSSSWRSQ